MKSFNEGVTFTALFRVLNMFIAIALAAPLAWGATGTVTVTEPTGTSVEVTSGFTMKGTYLLSSDTTPTGTIANNGVLPWCTSATLRLDTAASQGSIKHLASVEYKLDSVWKRQLVDMVMDIWVGPRNLVGTVFNYSTTVDITGLDPVVPHTATVYLQDIYGARCDGYSETFYGVLGDVVSAASVTFTINTPCNLQISTFTKDKATFDPYTQVVTFTGTISETSYRSVSWKVIVKDTLGNVKRTLNGSGKSPSATWNGKDEDGHVVPDGVYTATLSAWTNDNKCAQSRDIQVTVLSSCVDKDGDGHYVINGTCPLADDCNDDPANNGQQFYPGAPELCDNKDNDCDGQVDEAKFLDNDGDTFFGSQLEGCPKDFIKDCNDNDNSIKPGAPEKCGDLIDNNCNGERDENCSSSSCLVSPS